MGTGNSASVTVSTAGVAKVYTKNNCKKLDEKNQDERDKATEGLKEEATQKSSATNRKKIKEARTMIQGAGMAFSSALCNVEIGGGNAIQGTMSACSNAKAQECTSESMVKGGTPKMRGGRQRILCPKARYKHPEGGCGAHAEAKILNELTLMASPEGTLQGGSVLFKVDWRYGVKGKPHKSGMPCRVCYRAMCKAAKCGLNIMLCNNKNEPVPFDPGKKCSRKSKNPKKDPMRDLDRRMGEDPKTGLGPC
jgi:hypothetical protein